MRTRCHAAILSLLCTLAALSAAAAEPAGGVKDAEILKEYERFYETAEIPGWDTNGPDIIEFYSYNCSVCFQAEPFVARLRQVLPPGVSFDGQVIATGEMSWQLSQYAFAAARLGGVEEQMHGAMFRWLHVDGRPLETKQDVSEFFRGLGLLEAVSPYLESQQSKDMRKGIFERAIRYGVSRTPTFVVSGRYKVRWGSDQDPDKFAALLIALAQQSKSSRTHEPAPVAAGRCGPESGCESAPAKTEI